MSVANGRTNGTVVHTCSKGTKFGDRKHVVFGHVAESTNAVRVVDQPGMPDDRSSTQMRRTHRLKPFTKRKSMASRNFLMAQSLAILGDLAGSVVCFTTLRVCCFVTVFILVRVLVFSIAEELIMLEKRCSVFSKMVTRSSMGSKSTATNSIFVRLLVVSGIFTSWYHYMKKILMIGFDCVVNFISYVCLGLLPDAGYIFGAILIALTVVSAFSWKTLSRRQRQRLERLDRFVSTGICPVGAINQGRYQRLASRYSSFRALSNLQNDANLNLIMPPEVDARFDFKVRNMANDYKACAFITVIKAFACIPDGWFVKALERRIADAQENRTYNNKRTATDAEICAKLLELVDKRSFPEAWVGQSMKEIRFLLAKSEAEKNSTAANSFTKNIDMDPFRVIQAIISCLREDDQRSFQFRTMNVCTKMY
ncbi:hypothetical protein AAVH_12069 [Aphelenchoides avenae]|nr:hypothetical protein AAVH_12069 [Aphelenchus avenae]